MARNRKLKVTSRREDATHLGDDDNDHGILNPQARGIYIDLERKVRDMGLLMPVDHYQLSLLANELHDYQQVAQQIRDEGMLITDRDGSTRRNPLMMIRNKCFDNITTLCRQYALSPATRSTLPVQAPEDNTIQEGRFADRWASI